MFSSSWIESPWYHDVDDARMPRSSSNFERDIEMEESQRPKKCEFCGAVLEGAASGQSGEFKCRRCGTTARYEGADMVAIFIPNHHARLRELESLHREIIEDINLEGMKGEYRDMRYLQKKHLERQDVLTEYSFLSHFLPFLEKW
jgi:hypothetical protein